MEMQRRRRRSGAKSIHDLPDDSLRWILLRLDSPLWLIRAACVCKRWRRVVTDGSADEGRAFIRLASSLHPPTAVGQYHIRTNGDPRFVPSSSPPIDCNRFSVDDFLNTQYSRRHVADCHGGLVLLSTSGGGLCAGSAVPSLIVYDPLTRKHRAISGPPTRNDEQGFRYAGIRDVFLLDGDDGHISITNFKVLHRHLNDASAPTACVFSRGDGGEWGWRFLSRRLSDEDLYPRCSVYAVGRVDGSLYLGLVKGSRIIAIDSTSLAFSMVHLPIRVDTLTNRSSSSFTVVHGATGDFGRPTSSRQRTSIVHVHGDKLELFRRVQGSDQWVLEHTIANLTEAAAATTQGLLPVCPEKKGIRMAWSTMASTNADGAALAILSAHRSDIYDGRRWFFSIDVNTMELQVLPDVAYCRGTRSVFTYTLPWPQFLRACP